MFDEPAEDPKEHPLDPATRARDKCDEFRMHAELAAVFEAKHKFDAEIRADLSANVAREIQRTIGKLEKSKSLEHPVLPEQSISDALRMLDLPGTRELSTNDYHLHRRPGEVMIVRWLAGDEVETYYERLQAHFDAAMEGFREDERQALEWKADARTRAYLKALEETEVKMAERYLRDPIRQHNLCVLSTQSADELNIAYLADHIMGTAPGEIVGEASAPPEDGATEQELAWFFKLFSLRGMHEGQERMCFFAFLQKSDESGW